MSEQAFSILGGYKLSGDILVGGSKNTAFPIFAASLLAQGSIKFDNVPHILDILITKDIIKSLGVNVKEYFVGNYSVEFFLPQHINTVIPTELGSKIRGSLYFLGALLARTGRATIPFPGGCNIGERGFELHLDVFKQMGANVKVCNSLIHISCDKLYGKHIKLPFPSRGVTGNIMLAATSAAGMTIIENANTSPEIINLGFTLIDMGFKINGIGTDIIKIEGQSEKPFLDNMKIMIPPDKIEAATFLIASLITKGNIKVKNVLPNEMKDFINFLRMMNVAVSIEESSISVRWSSNINGASVITGLPPSLDADYEPLIAALLCILPGTYRIHDSINSERHLRFLPELMKMGANINILNSTDADITGVSKLKGRSDLYGKDIRGAVSLVLATLSVPENSLVYGIDQIDRGYEKLDAKLNKVGVETITTNGAKSGANNHMEWSQKKGSFFM